jgi:hypothetical protein
LGNKDLIDDYPMNLGSKSFVSIPGTHVVILHSVWRSGEPFRLVNEKGHIHCGEDQGFDL